MPVFVLGFGHYEEYKVPVGKKQAGKRHENSVVHGDFGSTNNYFKEQQIME